MAFRLRFFVIFFSLLIMPAAFAVAEPIDFDELGRLVNHSPNKALASITASLNKAPSSSERIQLSELLCETYLQLNSYDQIERLRGNMLNQLSSAGHESSLIAIEICYARSLVYRGKAGQALKLYDVLYKLAQSNQLEGEMAQVLVGRGQVYSSRGKYLLAMQDLTTAYALVDKVDRPDFEHDVLSAMGNLYAFMKQYEKAIEYYRKVLVLVENNGDDVAQSIACYNIANAYAELGRFQQARQYIDLARTIAASLGDALGVAYSDRLQADLYYKTGRYDSAMALAQDAEHVFQGFGHIEGLADLQLLQAKILFSKKDMTKGLQLAQLALLNYRESQVPASLAEAHKLLAEINSELSRFQTAYRHMVKLDEISSEIYNVDLNTQIVNLKTEFDAHVDEKEELLLKAQTQVRLAELEKKDSQRQVIYIVLITLLLVVLGLAWLLYNHRRANCELARVARTDSLTELPNRRHMMELLEQELARSRRYDQTFTIALFDADHFKLVNDRYGHHIGDRVLKKIATVATEALRNVDSVARFGGEEFLALLPNTDEANAAIIVERLRAAIEAISVDGLPGEAAVTVSIGYVDSSNDMDLTELLHQADFAMYAAKNTGRNRAMAAGQADQTFGLDIDI